MTAEIHSSSSGENGRDLLKFQMGHQASFTSTGFSTKPTAGLFSATALARLLKMREEMCKPGSKLGQMTRILVQPIESRLKQGPMPLAGPPSDGGSTLPSWRRR